MVKKKKAPELQITYAGSASVWPSASGEHCGDTPSKSSSVWATGMRIIHASQGDWLPVCIQASDNSPLCQPQPRLFRVNQSRPMSDCCWQQRLAALFSRKMEELYKSHSQSLSKVSRVYSSLLAATWVSSFTHTHTHRAACKVTQKGKNCLMNAAPVQFAWAGPFINMCASERSRMVDFSASYSSDIRRSFPCI